MEKYFQTLQRIELIRRITPNGKAMTSKGLRSDALSTDTKLDASYNVTNKH